MSAPDDGIVKRDSLRRIRGGVCSIDLCAGFCDIVNMETSRVPTAVRDHWYDGTFFDLCIAPNQDPVFSAVKAVIDPGSTVLDVGCGTGRLVFQLADHCKIVHGIDPSPRNIRRALELQRRRGDASAIAFEAASLEEHLSRPHPTYDFAVISFVLHEVDEQLRTPMLRALAGAARHIVLADYRVPRRVGLMDATTEVVEFFAGRDHYRGFKSFVRAGGLYSLIQQAGLPTPREQPCSSSHAQVLLTRPSSKPHSHA